MATVSAAHHSADGGPLEPLTVPHFAAFCSRLTLPPKAKAERRRGEPRATRPAPQPLLIEPFQKTIVTPMFDGVAETFVVLPKGNAKSMLSAALALYHLCFVDEAEVFVLAASMGQARRLLNMAAGIVRRSPVLRRHLDLKLGSFEIRAKRDGGYLKVLSSDPDTVDGIGPTLCICDELHRWPTLEAYVLAKEGLDKRGGQIIAISTAGEDENSAFGRMRKTALEHLQVRDGAFKYAPAPSGEFVWLEWSLDPADDLTDFELVKTANPLKQITVESLRARYESPGTRLAWWARFVCGIWTRDDEAAISAMLWAPCQVDHCRIPDGAEDVVIGVDFGWRRDTTALVPVWGMHNDPLTVRVDERLKILTPPGEGKSLSTDEVWAEIRTLSAIWPKATFVIDPNAEGEHVGQRIENELRHKVVLQAQDPSPMADAASLVMELVRERRLEHPGHLEYSSHVLAAYLKSVGASKQRFVKKTDTASPIDALIATAQAVRRLKVVADDPGPVRPFVINR